MLTFTIPDESIARPPTATPLTIRSPVLPEQMLTAIRKPELPGVHTSPVGFVVANSTAPVSGGRVELVSTRSPLVKVIRQPRLPIKFGVVQVRPIRPVLPISASVKAPMAATSPVGTVSDEDGDLSTTL
ncbi:hypothetical protein D9M68_915520 [compost metagenome]